MSKNCVMLQAFTWYLDENAPEHHWNFLKNKSDYFRKIGIDAVHLPPMSKTSNKEDVGYGVYDFYDIGEFSQKGQQRTKYGTKDELHDAVNALHGYKEENGHLVKEYGKKYIQVYADLTVNHLMLDEDERRWKAVRVNSNNRYQERYGNGFEEGVIDARSYTKSNYVNDQKRKSYSSFEWGPEHFDAVDTIIDFKKENGNLCPKKDCEMEVKKKNYLYKYLCNEDGSPKTFDDWVSLEKGNFDYLLGCDLDYGRLDVREEIKKFATWLAHTTGIDGFRIDATKHINADIVREFVGHVRNQVGKEMFIVCEHLEEGNTEPLHDYINRVSRFGPYPQNINVFDFPLQKKFRSLSHSLPDTNDLRCLNHGTMMVEQPALAVTFVENHDTQSGRGYQKEVAPWFKPLAYAFILLRDKGFPRIFLGDLFGPELKLNQNGKKHIRQNQSGKNYLELLIRLRKQFALGEERYYDKKHIIGFLRNGFVNGAKGGMVVTMSNAHQRVENINIDTGRKNKRFYLLAVIKGKIDQNGKAEQFEVIYNKYERYGEKSESITTNNNCHADFLAEGGTVNIWIEDGVGLE